MAWRSLTDNSVGRLNMGKYAIVLLFLSRHLSSHLSRCSCDWGATIYVIFGHSIESLIIATENIFFIIFSSQCFHLLKRNIIGKSESSPFSAPPPRWKAAHEFYYLFWLKSRPEQRSAYFGATTENAREKHENPHWDEKGKKKKVFLSPPNNENSVVSERTRARAAKTEA